MIIIPARLNSSRFANKILVDIFGLPMVIRTAKQVSSLDKVVISSSLRFRLFTASFILSVPLLWSILVITASKPCSFAKS